MEAAERKAFRLGKKLAADIRAGKVYPKQETVHRQTGEYFRQLVEMNRKEWAHEFEYWRRQPQKK
jgi:hypothetical protein